MLHNAVVLYRRTITFTYIVSTNHKSRLHITRAGCASLPPAIHNQLADAFQDAVAKLNLKKLGRLVLYQLRHGGASHDSLYKRRGYEDRKQRGRWRTDEAVQRYARPHVWTSVQAEVPQDIKKKAEQLLSRR